MKRILGSAFALTTLGGLPVFLIGALAVQIRAELGFEAAALGVLFLVFFGVSGFASIPAGHFIERLGPKQSSWLGVSLSVAVLLAIASAARSYEHLIVLVAIAAVSNAICQLSANMTLAWAVPDSRQGIAFGVKQAAVPAATLVGGLAVPAVALTVGWRWAFALSSGLAFFVRPGAAKGARPGCVEKRSPFQRTADGRVRLLLLLAVAVLMGSAAGNSLTGFLVESSVSAGMDPGAAGLTLALGSAVAIAVRILLGWRVDRRARSRPLGLVALLLLGGAGGYAVMAVSSSPVAIVAAAIACFGLGLGWNGLLVHDVVQAHRDAPAFATGVIQAGVYTGGALGPVLFGMLAARFSYSASWWMAAGVAATGAALTILVNVVRHRRSPVGATTSVLNPTGQNRS